MKIVFLDAATMGDADMSEIAAQGEFVCYPSSTPEQARERVADADVALLNKIIVDKEFLDAAPKLKLICEAGTGINNINVDLCRERGVAVRNVAAYSTDSVAQTAWMHILNLAGRAFHYDEYIRSGEYSAGSIHVDAGHPFTELAGKTLGIVGMGAIGQKVATIAVAFGMKVIYHNRKPIDVQRNDVPCTKSWQQMVVEQAEYVDFQSLLQDSDFVSLNLPYTPEVHHIIGKPELGMMKRSAYLINTARGAHVDEQALVEALKSGIIAGAAMDVYEHEPAVSSALLELPNVVLSPHTGTGTWEGRIAMCENVTDNILAFAQNRPNEMNIVI